MSTTPNLGLPYIDAGQAQKHVTHNEALRALDTLVQLAVLDRDLAAPPLSPAEGARWIVQAGASGAWSGRAGQVAAWQDGAWQFSAPAIGWLAYVADEEILVAWDGGSWNAVSAGGAREVLAANRTYYVSTSGSDSNDGLSAGSPFATLNKARDVILTLDLNGFTALIQHAAGQTPTAGLRWDAPPVGGNVILDLGGSFLQTSSGHAVVNNAPFALTVQNGKLGTTGASGSAITVNQFGLVTLGTGLEFGSAVDYHLNCGGAQIVARVSYTISGGAKRHLYCGFNGFLNNSAGTVTVSGAPAFSDAFAYAEGGGAIQGGATFSGLATGQRFQSKTNGTITGTGGSATYYPGDVAGSGTNAGMSPYGFYG